MDNNTQSSSFSCPEDGNAFPPNFIDLVWNYLKTSERERLMMRPLSRNQLELLVNTAYAASLQTDEGRQVRFQIVFTFAPSYKSTFSFISPIPFTVKQIVKLAPTIDIGSRWIIVRPNNPEDALDNKLVIAGIIDPTLSPQRESMNRWGEGLLVHDLGVLSGMKIKVFAPGHLRIETGGGEYIELQGCNIRFPFNIGTLSEIIDWYAEASNKIGFLPKDDLSHADARALIRRTWTRILAAVINAKHGGTFLIIPDELDISALLNIKYSINSPILRDSISLRAALQPDLSGHELGNKDISASIIDDAHFLECDLDHSIDLVSSLAAVDGAVIVRRNLTIEGFGAEIILPQEFIDITIKYGKHPHGTPPNVPLTNFGMRHRSAYRFCHNNVGTIAFVISQDTTIHVFCNIEGKVGANIGATAEDWWVYSTFRRDD